MNGKLLLGGIVAVLAAALPWWWPTGGGDTMPTPSRDLYAVRRDDLKIAIVENGTLVAKDSQKLAAKIKGESKILFLVEEGKHVAQDEVVCRLDETAVQTQLETLQLEILQTEANLKTARTELEIQTGENIAAASKAKAGLERANQEIEKYKEGQAPQERNKLLVAIKEAETNHNRAQKKFEDSKKLLAEAYIKQSELDEDEIAFERATVLLQSAHTDLSIFDKYTFPMQITELETKLADAGREVATAEKRGEATLGQKVVNVQQVEKRLQMQQKQLQERNEDLGHMTMKAPCPGIVVYGDPHEPWFRERVKIGAEIHGGFTVLTIPDLRVMQAKLQVHEADISKLQQGQKATITTDSYPGLQLAGEVTKIASVANSNSDWGGQSEVKKFDVEVTLAADDTQRRPGISAKIDIQVETRKQTLFVPLQCVFAEDGSHYCHVAGGTGQPTRRKVEVGSSNDTYIEVLDGLVVGERVLLYNPSLPGTGAPEGRATSTGAEKAAEPTGNAAVAGERRAGDPPAKSGS